MEKKLKNRLEALYGSPEYVNDGLSHLAQKMEGLRENRKALGLPAGENNEIIGRQTPYWNADSDQFNPYAPLGDLLYQRDRLIEKASKPTSERPESELETIKNLRLGSKESPKIYDKDGYSQTLSNITLLNELDDILQERTTGSDKDYFNKIKQVIDSSRKKLNLSPVNKLKK